VGADQLALCAFDGIAVFHPLFERFGFLLPSSLLQDRMMLAYRQRAVLLIGLEALLAQRALGTGFRAPFKPIRDSAGGLLLQTAALTILLPSRANRFLAPPNTLKQPNSLAPVLSATASRVCI